MTLTLEDLKNVRFPIAKKNGEGYRAIEVDAFLDQVDDTFSQLLDENARLKSQAGSGSAQGGDAASSALRDENEKLKAQIAELQRQGDARQGDAGVELQRLRAENADLRQQLQSRPADSGAGRLVVSTAADASPAVTRLVQLATEQAESVVSEAQVEADRKIADATSRAQQITVDATTRADRITSEAQANADRVNRDADTRRREMFGDLENERTRLAQNVEHLRDYEANYRQSLIAHYQQSIEALSNSSFAPGNLPTIQGGTSSTPRLDALLAEGN